MENLDNYRSKRAFSGNQAKQYPTDGPVGDQYKIYYDNLQSACLNSKEKISVLELGCGTGRYFHFLCNVEKLIGVDISSDMLNMSAENLKTLPELQSITRLVHSSLEDFTTDEKFDFIYSIGTLGEYCEFNKKLLAKVISYLKPGGVFFFTLVDSESFVSNEYIWPKKKIVRFLLNLLPPFIRNKINAKWLIYSDWKHLFLSRKQVDEILSSCKVPIEYELNKAKDSLHIHHIIKVWL